MWETGWSCCKSRDIGRGCKAVLCGSPTATSGVGMIVCERFRDAIASVERFDDRLMKIIVDVEERRCHFFSAYAPQTGCSEQTKDEFWSLLDEKAAEVPSEAEKAAGSAMEKTHKPDDYEHDFDPDAYLKHYFARLLSIDRYLALRTSESLAGRIDAVP
ncbi:unnamed protein product [Heligmosomoides polygyrus]|uniref:BLUF domain-containing protein n=1 Tax=Heligmosomoides polygyrus TaxID=6339 RepID=A0A183GDH8_HELPZ|nr:unnamed protein product [Heligmosomoides polygyrus]